MHLVMDRVSMFNDIYLNITIAYICYIIQMQFTIYICVYIVMIYISYRICYEKLIENCNPIHFCGETVCTIRLD